MADVLRGGCPSGDAFIYAVIASFTAAAMFNTVELNLQIFLNFQRRKGIYFWSLVIASWGCGIHAFGFILKFFVDAVPWQFYSTLISVGWISMITSSSVVLWSRLHLVVRSRYVLRAVLAMIVVDAICLHVPTTVLTWGWFSPQALYWYPMFAKAEKAQMTIFVVQESIISSLYVREVVRLLKPAYGGRTRKVLLHLLSVNVAVICMDAVILGMEYADHYEIQASLKPLIYSVKLKLEFVVLNQLMMLSNKGFSSVSGNSEPAGTLHHKQSQGTLGHKTSNQALNLANKASKPNFAIPIRTDMPGTSTDLQSDTETESQTIARKKSRPRLDPDRISEVSESDISFACKGGVSGPASQRVSGVEPARPGPSVDQVICQSTEDLVAPRPSASYDDTSIPNEAPDRTPRVPTSKFRRWSSDASELLRARAYGRTSSTRRERMSDSHEHAVSIPELAP